MHLGHINALYCEPVVQAVCRNVDLIFVTFIIVSSKGKKTYCIRPYAGAISGLMTSVDILANYSKDQSPKVLSLLLQTKVLYDVDKSLHAQRLL